jgi:hypothetical protein
MGGKQKSEIHSRLARAAFRFAAWRRMHEPHTRIPKPLWAAAVKLAAEFGISRTATRLRLNYNDLKKHLEVIAPPSRHASIAPKPPSFVELPASSFPVSGDCVIELENAAGTKMRIQIKGSHCPDLVALSAAFCNVEP